MPDAEPTQLYVQVRDKHENGVYGVNPPIEFAEDYWRPNFRR